LKNCSPHQKLLGDGVLTPVFYIISNKMGIFDEYQNTPHVLAARSIPVTEFDTHVLPRSFSCGFDLQEHPGIKKNRSKNRHLGSLTAANWVSFDLNVSYSSC